MEKKFSYLNETQKELYILEKVLKTLQELGGHAERYEIRERILDENDEVAEYAQEVRVSKKTNAGWRPFDFKFNYAFKGLQIAGYLTYTRSSAMVDLTEKGLNVDWGDFDAKRDVLDVAIKFWQNNKKDGRGEGGEDAEKDSGNIDPAEEYYNSFKMKLLGAVGKMSPKKFEAFSRELLKNMSIEFTEIGVQMSNDGGIDGYGYARTSNYQTQRVVIQCKRWQGSVGSQEIDKFLGAMNKYKADYGILITSGRYTASAREAALAGTPVTLIDGDELVRLVIKYKMHIYRIETYALDEYYDEAKDA